MLIPYSTEVLITKWPISNLLIIIACIAIYVLMITGVIPMPIIESMVLNGWNPIGLIGHQFIHATPTHLIFNMLFLWIFGNAVCEKVGNIVYMFIFLLFGVAAAALHNMLSGATAVGASGSINGIIGAYLVFYPVNRINCLFFYFFFGFCRLKTFAISGFWMISLWFGIDLYNAFFGLGTGIAYWAHIGGFICGVSVGFFLLLTRLTKMEEHDIPSLVDYLSKKKRAPAPQRQYPTCATAATDLAYNMVSRPTATRAPIPMPVYEPDINVDCPHCSQNMDIPPAMVGQVFACPTCDGELQILDK